MRRRDVKRPGRSRARIGRALALSALVTLSLVACSDEPTTPSPPQEDEDEGRRRPSGTLGVVEITISGLPSGQVTSSALVAASVPELERLRASGDVGVAGHGPAASPTVGLPDHTTGGGNGTIQLQRLAAGTFTVGVPGNGGYRYLYATYRVRNAQLDGTPYDTERRNLTFYAVDTEGTIGETAISRLYYFNGDPGDEELASSFVPTGAVMQDAEGEVAPRFADALQVFTEAEAADVLSIATAAGTSVTGVFPYGFVVQNTNTPWSRTLPADPDEGEFDGVVTFAFKVPLQSTPVDDPFTVSAMFLAVDDDEVKITQSAEEQTPAGRVAFTETAQALGAEVLTLLPPAGDAVILGGEAVRVLCDVRVAGPAGSPVTTTFASAGTSPWPVPSPFRAGHASLPRGARLGAASCANIVGANASTFAVHGSQSGRNVAGAYSGVGSFVRAPGARGGQFFPGEEVEVTLTKGLGGTKPVVARYRAAVSGGSGSFVVDSMSSGSYGTFSMASGDIDGDGDVDLVLVNLSGNQLSVLRNQGDGSFVIQPISWASANSVALGDLDGDGDLDLIVGHGTKSLAVLMNQGDGSFGSALGYEVGSYPTAIAVGDLDGDGDLDLAVANRYDATVTVLLNQGDGSFAVDDTYNVDSSWTESVAFGDVDGDGDLDLVVGTGNIVVLLNRGDGTFDLPTKYSDAGVWVALGDVDGDGDLDVVASGASAGNVAVLLNRGDGSFQSAQLYGAGGMGYSVALGDVDGDGDLDLVTTNYTPNTITVLFNQGNGIFGSQVSYAGGNRPWPIAIADLDGDGDLDVVTANSAGNATAVVLWNQ